MIGLKSKAKRDQLSIMLQAYQSAVNEAAIVSITDTSGKIIYVNDKFVEISKYAAEELIGQTHRIINSGHHSKEFFSTMWKTIASGVPWRGQIRNRAKDGSFYWVDTVITPLKDQKGKTFQYLSIRNLITLQKEHEENLERVQQQLLQGKQQLKDAQTVSKTGSWYLDIPGESLEWSEETYRIFEIPQGTAMTNDSFLKCVHPDDKDMLHQSWQQALKTGEYDVEHRIFTSSGEKWVREKARFEFDHSSALLKALGTVQDITEKKSTENILKQSERLYRDLFNNSPFAVGIIDKLSLKFLEVNETATKLYGYTREEFLQLTTFDIRVQEQHGDLKKQMEGGKYASDRSERKHRKKNGEIIVIIPTISEILYNEKQAYLISIHDITERLRIEEELAQVKINRQKEIIRASIESEEKSRGDIARELHDNINQLLVASTIFLKHALRQESDAKSLISEALDIISSAMGEIRKLSSSVVPPSLSSETLKETIEQLSKNFELSGTHIKFDISIDEKTMDEPFKINLYRIIQELCNNIIKHSGAANGTVCLLQSTDQLKLQITDDGGGFDPLQKSRGIGLGNIIHRTEAYHGKIDIESSPGKGTVITIIFSFPLHY